MALVTLPATPGPRSVSWSLRDPGGTLQGPLGGAAQRVNRLGARWRCEVTLPAMTPGEAREWAAALARGLRYGVVWSVRQVGTPVGLPGSPLINGADQAGDSIVVDGARAGYSVAAGQWLNISTGGRKYLYQAAAYAKLTGGAGTIEIEPPLRAVPADNDPVTLALPVIEGLLVDAPSWAIDANRLVNGITFAIEEVR
jgi:hypothetical protein